MKREFGSTQKNKMTFNRDLEFYSLETKGVDFCDIMKEINQKKNVSSKNGGRVLEEGSFDISLLNFKDGNDFCEGIVARSNKDDLPLVGNLLSNILRIIGLKKNEGIIDMTYFCYIKNLKILCLLPARKGVKWGTFKHYIQNVHVIKENFDMYILFTKKVMEIYKKMGSITLIDAVIDIGNNSTPGSEDIKGSPLKPIITNAKNSNASRIRLEIFNEKRSGGLKIIPIKKIVDYLRELGVLYDSKSIRVKGSASPAEKDIIIDLIKNRYKLTIELGNNSRHLVFKECCDKVHDLINNKLDEIGELVE